MVLIPHLFLNEFKFLKDKGLTMIIKTVLILIPLLLLGCASTKGSIHSTKVFNSNLHYKEYDRLVFSIKDSDISLTKKVKNRIVDLVKQKIQRRNQEAFDFANDLGRQLNVTIYFKEYDEGSIYLRALAHGLGQIHIEADLVIEDSLTHKVLAKYYVTKTFAWGGIYGVLTTIEDVEDGFAETIVSILLEEKDLEVLGVIL